MRFSASFLIDLELRISESLIEGRIIYLMGKFSYILFIPCICSFRRTVYVFIQVSALTMPPSEPSPLWQVIPLPQTPIGLSELGYATDSECGICWPSAS